MAKKNYSSGEPVASWSAQADPKQLAELKAAIKQVGPSARRDVRKRLKSVGLMVKSEIDARAPVYGGKRYGGRGRRRAIGRGRAEYVKSGAHAPGLLRKSTRLNIKSLSVAVYNDAKAIWSKGRRGFYRYGKRLEFDPRYSVRLAFFYPGWDAAKPKAGAEFDKVLDEVAAEFGRG